MKIVVLNPKTNKIYLQPDTALLGSTEDFYTPAFSTEISASFGYVAKVSKPGKHIQKEFISNHYSQIGIAVNFIAEDIVQTLENTSIATSFDKSFLPSHFINAEVDTTASFSINNSETYTFSNREIKGFLETSICKISEYFTLKTGDIIFIEELEDIPVTEKDMISCDINGNKFSVTIN